jgi:hypothetical protein
MAVQISNDEVFVAEFVGNRIQVFDKNGFFINGNEQFATPYSICVTALEVFVCDYRNCRICVFDKFGKMLRTFGSRGNEAGQMDDPRGICVDKGLIYVSSSSCL